MQSGFWFIGKTVSRVLSFKAIIYLDLALPQDSSHPSGLRKIAVRQTPHSVLHQVGFTWQYCLQYPGELLPRLSTLTEKSAVYLCCTFPKVTLGGR